NDWTQYRFDAYATGVNPETQITTTNAAQLKTAWTYTAKRPFLTASAIVDGVVYIPNYKSLDAFALRTGKLLWHFDDIDNPYGGIFSSPAVDPVSHIAYYGTPDARVYAVNTVTHAQVWMVHLDDPKNGAFIWSSPLFVNGKVYVGMASH